MPSVLIVDDHAGFRGAARRLLERGGFDVVGDAADGEAALTQAEALRPDVVLLDVQLPDIDGFEVARRIAAGRSRAAVILVSSREAHDYGSVLDGAPVRGFLSKHGLTSSNVCALLENGSA